MSMLCVHVNVMCVVIYVSYNKRKYDGKKKSYIYESILLRESYREGGKVKHRTITNLTNAKPEEIESIKLALKHKNNLSSLINISEDMELESYHRIAYSYPQIVYLLHSTSCQFHQGGH